MTDAVDSSRYPNFSPEKGTWAHPDSGPRRLPPHHRVPPRDRPVSAASVAQGVPAQEVDITVTPDGFDAPTTLRAGAATPKVRSAGPSGAWLGLVRPRPGVTLDRCLDDLRRAMGDDPAEAVEGSRAVARDAEMLGGVAVAHAPASVTIPLTPGDHYLIDFRDAGLSDLASRVRPVRVLPGHASSQVRPSRGSRSRTGSSPRRRR